MMYPRSLSDDRYMVSTLRELTQDPYFDFVEIKGVDEPVLVKELQTVVQSTHMETKFCAHPRIFSQSLDPNSINEEVRKQGVNGIKKAIDEAISLGIKEIGLPSGPMVADPADEIRAIAQLKKSLVELCNYAKPFGAYLYLEPFDTDIDKCRLIGNTDVAAEVAADVMTQCDNFNLMVDLSHIPLLQENIEDCIHTLASYIGHAHIGNCYMKDEDNPAYGDRHPPYDYPGTEIGEDEICRYLEALIKVGYINKKEKRSSLAFEIMPVDPDESALALANAKQTLDKAWKRINY